MSDVSDISVVVSASSLERPFLVRLIEQCLVFADNVVVSSGSMMYDGREEDAEYWKYVREHFLSAQTLGRVRFITYAVGTTELLKHAIRPNALHNRARREAVAELLSWRREVQRNKTWVLFLDGDEVPDGKSVRTWWTAVNTRATVRDNQRNAYKLANHWYFLLPTLRAGTPEDSVLLVHQSVLETETEGVCGRPCRCLSDDNAIERDGIARSVPGVVHRMVGAGSPMFHHFSWVRSMRVDLERKVGAWGHRDDRPWTTLLRRAWNEIESGRPPTKDFVHGYNLERVPLDAVRPFCCDADALSHALLSYTCT
jgi:hypothetical protein